MDVTKLVAVICRLCEPAFTGRSIIMLPGQVTRTGVDQSDNLSPRYSLSYGHMICWREECSGEATEKVVRKCCDFIEYRRIRPNVRILYGLCVRVTVMLNSAVLSCGRPVWQYYCLSAPEHST